MFVLLILNEYPAKDLVQAIVINYIKSQKLYMTAFLAIESTTYPRDIMKILLLPTKLSLEQNKKIMKELNLIQ